VERGPTPSSEAKPDVPEAIGRFAARLLPKAPEERFATEGEALRELQVLRGSTPTPPPEMLQVEPAPVEAVTEGSSSKKLNETTDKLFDDETPPIARHT